MVLAAGLGMRMRPLTDRMPKPLVPVGGKPLLDHVLDRLAEAGVERAVVNVHHFAEQIIDHVENRDAPAGHDLGRARAAARHRRRGGEGAAEAGRRAVLPSQRRHHLDRRRAAKSRAAGGSVRCGADGRASAAGADRRQCWLFRARRFFHGQRWHLAQARRTRGRALRLCRRGDPDAGAVQRRARGRLFAHRAVRPRGRSRPALRPAPGRPVDACRHARGDSARPKPPSRPARSDFCMLAECRRVVPAFSTSPLRRHFCRC